MPQWTMPLADESHLHTDMEPESGREEAMLCPVCGLPGLAFGSVNPAYGKWRVVYMCPVCKVRYYTFKRQKMIMEA